MSTIAPTVKCITNAAAVCTCVALARRTSRSVRLLKRYWPPRRVEKERKVLCGSLSLSLSPPLGLSIQGFGTSALHGMQGGPAAQEMLLNSKGSYGSLPLSSWLFSFVTNLKDPGALLNPCFRTIQYHGEVVRVATWSGVEGEGGSENGGSCDGETQELGLARRGPRARGEDTAQRTPSLGRPP